MIAIVQLVEHRAFKGSYIEVAGLLVRFPSWHRVNRRLASGDRVTQITWFIRVVEPKRYAISGFGIYY